MAIVEMKKLRLLGLKNEENSILDALHKTRTVELKITEEFENLNTGLNKLKKDDLSEKISRLSFAVNLIEESEKEIKKYVEEDKSNKVKKPFFKVKDNVSFHDFSLISAREYEIFTYVETLEEYNEKLTAIKSETSKQLNLIEQLKLFKDIEVPLKAFSDTKNTSIMLGTIPSEFETALTVYSETEQDVIVKIYNSGFICAVAVICGKADFERVWNKLSQFSFSKVSFAYDFTAAQMIEKCQQKISELKKERLEVLEKIINFNTGIAEIKLLYDYFSLSVIKKEYEENFKSSSHVFIMEGFLPAENIETVRQAILNSSKNVIIEFFDVTEGDNPPTLTKNSKLVAPFESVTNMFSVPMANERDPNFFMSIFFFIFFGIMLSDAGYGLILAIGAAILLKKNKMELGIRNIIKIIALGGISTFIWGALLGGWFGLDLNAAAESGNAIAQFLLSLQWFNPMQEPLLMLGLCLAIGVIHILFGLGIKAGAMIRKGKILDAVMDVGSWYLLFIGIGFMAVSMVPELAFLSNAGTYIFYASLLMLVLTQGRAQKGIFKKLFKGVSSLYGIVGYLSDILSYARLFGLGLATGVVGLVMNTIAGMLFQEWYLAWFGLIVLIGGHVFNIGINVLGAYIHNSRLQYIEFFSKFYTGGGHAFIPYGSNLKYHHIK